MTQDIIKSPREIKIENLQIKLQEAKEKEQYWKVTQLEQKLNKLKPLRMFWNSLVRGTYVKEVKND